MTVVINGTTGITTPTESVATTIGVGGATPSASGSGITFPATQSASTDANTLDDYEEGTWTPSFVVYSGSATYTTQNGRYIKIGSQVTCSFWITINVSSSLTSAGVQGFPFTSASNAQYTGVTFSSVETGGFGGFCNLNGLVVPSNTNFQIRSTNSATAAPTINALPVTNGTVFAGSFTYFTS